MFVMLPVYTNVFNQEDYGALSLAYAFMGFALIIYRYGTDTAMLKYSVQENPEGISHAFLQAEEHLSEDDITVFILGDNFFEYNPLSGINLDKSSFKSGCYIFSYEVENPRDFGVAELDNVGKVIAIEEKPENPKSNNAIVGVYVFDGTVINKIKTLKPSARG